jgi:ABC-type multidrug transport system fused ATPase/permease subunit
MINLFDYILEFIGNSKLYYTFYLLLIPIVPIFRNFIIPELLGIFYADIKNKSKAVNILYLILLSYFTLYTSELTINFMAWRAMVILYEFIILNIYDYIYDNTYCNYDNLNISEIILKIAKMSKVCDDLLRIFTEEFCYIFFAILIGLFYFYFKLGSKYLIVFSIFVSIIFCIQIFNVNYIGTLNVEKEKRASHVYGEFSDSLYNISTVQSFQNKSNEIGIIRSALHHYNEMYRDTLMKSLAIDTVSSYTNLTMTAVLGYMLWSDYNKNIINTKILFQTSQIVVLMAFICDFINVTGRNVTNKLGEIRDINTFMNNEIPYDNECKKGDKSFSNGDIIYKNIFHKYKTTGKFALENVSVHIKKGEKVALVGQSGSGKSTMVKLLLKHQCLLRGSITINKVNVSDMSAKELATNIFYIPQYPKLFNRSLYKNIIYGVKNPPKKEEILTILDNMKLEPIAKVFKDKMDVDVGRDGSALSGGQKQIVWLLRSLYRMKPIVMLDEPTASLDKESKVIVIDAIKKITVGKTVIMVTHDSVDSSFRQINFKSGKIQQSFWN